MIEHIAYMFYDKVIFLILRIMNSIRNTHHLNGGIGRNLLWFFMHLLFFKCYYRAEAASCTWLHMYFNESVNQEKTFDIKNDHLLFQNAVKHQKICTICFISTRFLRINLL